MLGGIKVLELEGLGPGPFAGMTLADLGANVITVQRGVELDVSNISKPDLLNRGKRSIVLDLKNRADANTLRELIIWSDVLIEGFRPGVMERLGFSEEKVFALNPSIIFGRITGWGQHGPRSMQAGHDLNYIGVSGALHFASLPGDAPVTPATLVGDIGGGALYLVIGILAALQKVQRGELGTVIDAAIVDGSAHMMNLLMSLTKSDGLSMERGKSLLDGPHWSRSYICSDKTYISVQCLESKFYFIFLSKLGLANDPNFLQQHNKDLWPSLNGRLEEIFKENSRDYWNELFIGSDGCLAPVLSPEESSQDTHMLERKTWQKIEGTLQANPAPRFSNWEKQNSFKIPTRGQHTEEILKELKN